MFRDIINPHEPQRGERAPVISLKSTKKGKTAKTTSLKNAPPSQKSSKLSLLIKENPNSNSSDLVRQLAVVLCLGCFLLFAITSIYLGKTGLRMKKNIVDAASIGFEKIMNGAMSLKGAEFENAKRLFGEASQTFKNIQYQTWFTAPKIATLRLDDPLFISASAMIKTGEYLSSAGATFTGAASDLQFIPKNIFNANNRFYNSTVARPSLTEELKKQIPTLLASAKDLGLANEQIQKIPPTFIPTALRDRFGFAKDALSTLVGFLDELQADIPAILKLLGDKEPHTFLILLQNNAELRPSGGFIGNYMIVETNDGYVTKMNIFDVYTSDHQLTETIEPPVEIMPVNTRWFMRDSNYSGHFPLSAQKAAWFLEKERGPGVDTVISIDQSLITEMLRLTGPIKIPELSRPLTGENFTTVISYIVESKLTGKSDPKAILRSFLPLFEKAVFEYVDPTALLPMFQSAIESKHLMVYSKDEEVEAFFKRHGMAGLMTELQPKQDYLNIVHTSIGGNKSDDYVAEIINHDTYLNLDGSVVDEVTITRAHQWNADVEKKITATLAPFGFTKIPLKIWEILGRSRNLHMLRIYVPAGATLESASDKSVSSHFDDELGKTYFSVKMQADVGALKKIKIRYVLPFKLDLDPIDKYSIIVQKQPGQSNVSIQKRILPESRVMNYKYFPDNAYFDADGVLNYETELTKDTTFSSIWGK